MRSEALTNLLLASSSFRGWEAAEKRAPYFVKAWWDACRDHAKELPLTEPSARELLVRVLALCEAEGISKQDLVPAFNDARLDLNRSSDEALKALLETLAQILLAKSPKPEKESA